jgi:hypothetical protein
MPPKDKDSLRETRDTQGCSWSQYIHARCACTGRGQEDLDFFDWCQSKKSGSSELTEEKKNMIYASMNYSFVRILFLAPAQALGNRRAKAGWTERGDMHTTLNYKREGCDLHMLHDDRFQLPIFAIDYLILSLSLRTFAEQQ